jgi:hypothetical protein
MRASDADGIWNRAAAHLGGSNPAQGDRHLAALLRVHGLIMNGGVQHAAETISPADISAAAEGFLFFGFEDVAMLLREVVESNDLDAELADKAYTEVISSEQVLSERFREVLSSRPHAFAPL